MANEQAQDTNSEKPLDLADEPELNLVNPAFIQAVTAMMMRAKNSGMHPVTICASLLGATVSFARTHAEAKLEDIFQTVQFVWNMADEVDKQQKGNTPP